MTKFGVGLTILGLIASQLVFAQKASDFKSTEKFDSWVLGCLEEKNNQKQCVIFQTVTDPKNKEQEILKVTLGNFDRGNTGMIISAPLGVALVPGIDLKLDGKDLQVEVKGKDGKASRQDIKGLSYERCSPNGCFSALPLDNTEIARLKKGNKLNITVFASPDPASAISLEVSLKGFTKAIDALIAASK